jgi:hypothetical protein
MMAIQLLEGSPMIEERSELALDLSNLIRGLPSHGYVVISDLPHGSRLSHGFDGGDNTWTLMADELPGLKFLPGPARGLVSLKAQIFDPTSGLGQTKKEFPLILHMAEAGPAQESKAPTQIAAGERVGKSHEQSATIHLSAESQRNQVSSRGSGEDAKSSSALKGGITQPAATRQEQSVHSIPPSSGAERLVISESSAAKQKIWGVDAERRFADAFAALRQEADEMLQAAERRHRSEVEELSRAIAKQHELITTLKKEAEQTALRHVEAERSWQTAEAAKMKVAQDAWAKEKEGLRRERAMKEQEFAAELKRITADAERLVEKTRTDFESAVLRSLGEVESKVRDFSNQFKIEGA